LKPTYQRNLDKKTSTSNHRNAKNSFLKKENGFKTTLIKTGTEINGFVQVVSGIDTNDKIAENAQYLVDSGSFIKTE
jgi:Cu(I)/Ag(I) efflux system membrane fusion protein